MTVTYSLEVATTGFGTLIRLMRKWHGSLYKCIYKEAILYFAAYFFLSFVYRVSLTEAGQRNFESICIFCAQYTSSIPITFILGFYVNIVFQRWNNYFIAIPMCDQYCLKVAAYLRGEDQSARLYRRTIARYLTATEVLVLRDISAAVKKRFPTMRHVVDAGLMSDEEFERYDEVVSNHSKQWALIQWALSLLVKAREEGRIASDVLLNGVTDKVLAYWAALENLLSYDWISIPLVYTQVVAIGTWMYFIACMFSRQYLYPNKDFSQHKQDYYIPIFTMLEFTFYVGWLKVAESMLNPLGEDDDDFEVNYIIDKNLQVAYLQMDDNSNNCPPLQPDAHWDDVLPELPHTAASIGQMDHPPVHSTADIDVPPEQAQVVEHPYDRKVSRQSSLLQRIVGISRHTSLRQSVIGPKLSDAMRKISRQRFWAPENKVTPAGSQANLTKIDRVFSRKHLPKHLFEEGRKRSSSFNISPLSNVDDTLKPNGHCPTVSFVEQSPRYKKSPLIKRLDSADGSMNLSASDLMPTGQRDFRSSCSVHEPPEVIVELTENSDDDSNASNSYSPGKPYIPPRKKRVSRKPTRRRTTEVATQVREQENEDLELSTSAPSGPKWLDEQDV